MPRTPLPNGVGVQGRGRALSNVPLTQDANSLAALQERKQSLLAAAEYRPMRAIVSVTPAGAAKFDEMPDQDGEAAFAVEIGEAARSGAAPWRRRGGGHDAVGACEMRDLPSSLTAATGAVLPVDHL